MLLAVIMIASYGGMRAKAASNLRYDADDVHDGTVGLWYIADIYYYAFLTGSRPLRYLPDPCRTDSPVSSRTVLV